MMKWTFTPTCATGTNGAETLTLGNTVGSTGADHVVDFNKAQVVRLISPVNGPFIGKFTKRYRVISAKAVGTDASGNIAATTMAGTGAGVVTGPTTSVKRVML